MGRVQLQVAVFLLKDKNALQRRHNLNIQVSLHWADVKNEKVLIMSVTRLDSNSSEPQRELQIQSGSKHLLNPPFMKCLWRGRYCLEMLLWFGNLHSFISSTFFDWEALESHPSLMSSIQTSLHFFHNHWLIISLLEAIYLLSFHHLVLGAFWDKENHHWASGRHTLTCTHCQGNEEECRSDVPVIKSTEFGLLKRNILSSLQVCMFVMCMCECMGYPNVPLALFRGMLMTLNLDPWQLLVLV